MECSVEISNVTNSICHKNLLGMEYIIQEHPIIFMSDMLVIVLIAIVILYIIIRISELIKGE